MSTEAYWLNIPLYSLKTSKLILFEAGRPENEDKSI